MAVYTRVNRHEIDQFLENYNLGRCEGLIGITSGVENTNYMLMTEKKQRYILTLYEKRVSADDLPFFIELMAHMAEAGIICPKPVADRKGDVIQTLKTRKAAIFTFLNGRTTHPTPAPPRCYSAGQMLARIHKAGVDFKGSRKNALDHQAWRPLLKKSKERGVLPMEEFKQAENWLKKILSDWPQKNLPRGIVHADLFPDNILFTKGNITGVIDFYFACDDFFAYDLAIMVNAWCFDSRHRFKRQKFTHLIAGYQSIRPLNDGEIDAFLTFCQGGAMRFYLTRLYDSITTPKNAKVQIHDPMDYLKRLEFFHSRDAGKDCRIHRP